MQDTYDPFSFLLGEIHAYDTGQRSWEPERRERYLDQLIADEAEEISWGRRHLSVIVDVNDKFADEVLEQLINGMIANLPTGTWSRIGGVAGRHTTITVDGPQADHLVALMADVLAHTNVGGWRTLATAVVGGVR